MYWSCTEVWFCSVWKNFAATWEENPLQRLVVARESSFYLVINRKGLSLWENLLFLQETFIIARETSPSYDETSHYHANISLWREQRLINRKHAFTMRRFPYYERSTFFIMRKHLMWKIPSSLLLKKQISFIMRETSWKASRYYEKTAPRYTVIKRTGLL